MTNTKLFTNARYITRGISCSLHPCLMSFIWDKVDALPDERDYLQVFDLYEENGKQMIRHRAAEPEHCTEYEFPYQLPSGIVENKVYVIDDGDHSTMLYADEY